MSRKKTIKEKVVELKNDIQEQAVKLIDENGDGAIGLDDFVIKALKMPGVKINREEFLYNALKKYCDEETIKNAVETTPAKAGVSKEIIRKASKETIALQKTIASTTSLGLGYAPGGLAVEVASTVADISQYYFHLLVITQKLLYLYSYPNLNMEEQNGQIDDGTMNLIVICLAVMAGVGEAGKALLKIIDMLAAGVAKQLINKALTKTIVFQLTKKLLKWFGIKLTKEVFTKGISNFIKFLGGALIGGITFFSFTKCCDNFIAVLEEGNLWDPDYVRKANSIEAEFTEKDVEEALEKEIDLEKIIIEETDGESKESI